MIRNVLAARNSLSGPLATAVTGVAVPWWLAGGVDPADVVAAWQPKGAASYADSLRDLTGNGYDAYPGVDPSWTAADGWIFGGSKHLKTDLVPVLDTAWTMIVRYIYAGTSSMYWPTVAGMRQYQCCADFAIAANNPNTSYTGDFLCRNGYEQGASGLYNDSVVNGIVCMAGQDIYLDGQYVKSMICTPYTKSVTTSIMIGAFNRQGVVSNHFVGKIQAIAIYSTTLTASQVAAITAAMQAL